MKLNLITLFLLFISISCYAQHIEPSFYNGEVILHHSLHSGIGEPKLEIEGCVRPESGFISFPISVILHEDFVNSTDLKIYITARNSNDEIVGQAGPIFTDFIWTDAPIQDFYLNCEKENYFHVSGAIQVDVSNLCPKGGLYEYDEESYRFCFEMEENNTIVPIDNATLEMLFPYDCFNKVHEYLHGGPTPDENFTLPACSNVTQKICCRNNNLPTQGDFESGPGKILDSGNDSEIVKRNSRNNKTFSHHHSHTAKTFHIYDTNGNYIGHYHNLDRYKNSLANLRLYIVVTTENGTRLSTEKRILSFD